MYLNTIAPAEGAKKTKNRVGRGIGSGSGKTCGRGHKGQKARSGGYHKLGFEGGQMPLQRRVPKFGFNSFIATTKAEIRTAELNKLEGRVDLAALRNADLIKDRIKQVKIMLSGDVKKALTIAPEIGVSKGARAAIEAAGGKIEEANG